MHGSCRIALPSPQRTMASLDVDSKERGATDRAFVVINQELQRLEYLRIIYSKNINLRYLNNMKAKGSIFDRTYFAATTF